jgi:hypothetical protein
VNAGGVIGDDQSDEWRGDAALGGRFIFSVAKTDLGLYAYRGVDPEPTYGNFGTGHFGSHSGTPPMP